MNRLEDRPPPPDPLDEEARHLLSVPPAQRDAALLGKLLQLTSLRARSEGPRRFPPVRSPLRKRTGRSRPCRRSPSSCRRLERRRARSSDSR